MIFFTSDTHFGHANIIHHSQRPFKTCWEMDDELIKRWNSVVSVDDTVFHLGDFAYKTSRKNLQRIVAALNGRIILLKGNHDRMAETLVQDKVFSADKLSLVPSYYELEGFEYTDDDGDVQHGPKFVLCHYPLRSWNQMHRGAIHLFGHCHGTIPDHFRSTDVGVDRWNYTPISTEEIIDYMDKKPIAERHRL